MNFLRRLWQRLWLRVFGVDHKVIVDNVHVATVRVRPRREVHVDLSPGMSCSNGVIKFDPPINRTKKDGPIVVEYRYEDSCLPGEIKCSRCGTIFRGQNTKLCGKCYNDDLWRADRG